MGRVKSSLIKETTKKLLAEESRFSEDFEKNKKILNRLLPSKRIRNMTAGYISRIKKRMGSRVAKNQLDKQN